MPHNLAPISIVMFDPEHGVPQLLGPWANIGHEDDARHVIALSLSLNTPVIAVQNISTNRLLHIAGFGFVPLVQRDSTIHSAYSANMTSISASALLDAFEKMCVLYEAHPDARASSIEMEHFPNQAMAIASAFLAGRTQTAVHPGLWPSSVAGSAPACARWAAMTMMLSIPSTRRGMRRSSRFMVAESCLAWRPSRKAWDLNNVFDYNVTLPTECHCRVRLCARARTSAASFGSTRGEIYRLQR